MAEKFKTKIVQAMTFSDGEPVVYRRILLDKKGRPVIRRRGWKRKLFYVTVD